MGARGPVSIVVATRKCAELLAAQGSPEVFEPARTRAVPSNTAFVHMVHASCKLMIGERPRALDVVVTLLLRHRAKLDERVGGDDVAGEHLAADHDFFPFLFARVGGGERV